MRIIPPWSREEALQWQKTHPWLSGFYWGLASGELLAIVAFLGKDTTEAEALTLGVLWGLVVWLLKALSINRGWWERKDDPHATTDHPKRRKSSWSRTSDNGLRWAIAWGVVSVIAVTYGLLTGKTNPLVFLGFVGVNVPLIFVWRELKRRKQTGGPLRRNDD